MKKIFQKHTIRELEDNQVIHIIQYFTGNSKQEMYDNDAKQYNGYRECRNYFGDEIYYVEVSANTIKDEIDQCQYNIEYWKTIPKDIMKDITHIDITIKHLKNKILAYHKILDEAGVVNFKPLGD